MYKLGPVYSVGQDAFVNYEENDTIMRDNCCVANNHHVRMLCCTNTCTSSESGVLFLPQRHKWDDARFALLLHKTRPGAQESRLVTK